MSISRLAKGVKDENFPGGKAKIEVIHVLPTSCFNWFKYMANMKIGYDNRNIFCLGVKKKSIQPQVPKMKMIVLKVN